MRKHLVLTLTLVLAGCLFIPSLGLAKEKMGKKALKKVSINTGHTPWFYWAPYEVAIRKGWFAKEGLDVRLDSSRGGIEATQMVAYGTNQFGDGPALVWIRAMSKEMPVKFIAKITDKTNSVAVFFLKNSGIEKLEDLVGKKVALNSFSHASPVFEIALKEKSISRKKIGIIQPPLKQEWLMLIDRKVDAYVGNGTTEKGKLSQSIKDYGCISLKDQLKIPGPGYFIVGNAKFVKENPEVAAGFIRAALKGWEYARKNPDEAIRILVENHRELDFKTERNSFDVALETSDFPEKMGKINSKELQKLADVLLNIGWLEKEVNIDKFVTNEFVSR